MLPPVDTFHKAFFQWQMTKVSDKSADNQSEARISVAYNKDCHMSLMISFVKRAPARQVILRLLLLEQHEMDDCTLLNNIHWHSYLFKVPGTPI